MPRLMQYRAGVPFKYPIDIGDLAQIIVAMATPPFSSVVISVESIGQMW